ncbi:MAG: tetratricopeptide repeat protein [Elusimicrobia bacterium]|nr:tetratricopeptide repeat protein [Elusimicrobiota bacterium]
MNTVSWEHRVMVIVLASLAYVPTLRLGFLWDDHVMIESNPHLREWTTTHVKHDFTTDVFDGHGEKYYRPAQTFANRVDFTGRAELMSLFFSLTSLLLCLRGFPSVLMGSLAYGLALLSKESAIMTPALVALVLYFKRQPLRKFWPVVVLILISGPFLWLRGQVVGSPLPQMDQWLIVRFFVQAFPKVLVRYFTLSLIPWNLHSHRMMPHLSHFWPLYLFLVVGLGAWLFWKNYRVGILCWVWFILTLLPKTVAMITGNFMLDHWAYPCILAVLLPMGMWFSEIQAAPRRWLSHASRVLYCGVLIFWASLVHLNVRLRGTDEKMFRWALHFSTSTWVHCDLGVVLLQTGRAAEAIPHLELAHSRYPENMNCGNALALAYWSTGQRQRALSLLEQLARERPDDLQTSRNLQNLRSLTF